MKKNIIFLGDSITDAFHKMNVDPLRLGNGYVSMIAVALRKMGRTDFIRNGGHDGFTVSGLLRLFEYDCLQYDPDIVSVLIGSNDAAIAMNTGKSLAEQKFAENYAKLLAQIRERTRAHILCMGPFIFPKPLEYANWFPVIRQAEKMEQVIAERYHASFLPLQDCLNQQAEAVGYDRITVDGTHLTEEGAEMVADLWIQEALRQGWLA